jgi:hypothetical protein
MGKTLTHLHVFIKRTHLNRVWTGVYVDVWSNTVCIRDVKHGTYLTPWPYMNNARENTLRSCETNDRTQYISSLRNVNISNRNGACCNGKWRHRVTITDLSAWHSLLMIISHPQAVIRFGVHIIHRLEFRAASSLQRVADTPSAFKTFAEWLHNTT